MTVNTHIPYYSAFNELGFKQTIRNLIDKTKALYLKDDIPWVIGYSGGKDSTAILQITWSAVQELAAEGKAQKTVHVISTDTLVENPIVALWVEKSLHNMRIAVNQQKLPIQAHRLTPKVTDRFWVNLIGRGYPAPRYKFRWCTDRLKISPSNTFIQNVVKKNGEAILVLGTRKHESTVRAANMEGYESRADNTRREDGLTVNKDLDRVWVYTPIADWTNDDVWSFLTQVKNPWGFKNTDLLGMYQGATEGGECPLVVDKSTPSCGDSRFGCYVCTMVGEDKSMAAMIANDEEKEWMLPLLELRNEIDVNDSNKERKISKINRDKSNRDFRRMNGSLTVHISDHGADIVRGPYRQVFREHMLRKVLEAQTYVQQFGPDEVRHLELLSLEDLEEIRRLWIESKNEIEDNLPTIYKEATGRPYRGTKRSHHPLLNNDVLSKLKSHCEIHGDKDGLKYEQVRTLLSITDRYKHQLRRSKLFEELEKAIDKGAFNSIDEARKFALSRTKNELTIKLQQKGLDDESKKDLLGKIEKIEEAMRNHKLIEQDMIEIEEFQA